MSALSEKVGIALYAALNVSGVTSKATGGVWRGQPSDSAALPYVVVTRQAPGETVRTFGQMLIMEDDLWLIKSVADEDAHSAFLSTGAHNEAVLAACLAAHGTSLTLSGGSVTWLVERVADIPTYNENFADRVIVHDGYLLRIVAAP